MLCMGLLAGCAAPVGTPITQTVLVETPGCLAATCSLSNDQGSWRVERTPGEVTIVSSREPLRVACRSDDEEQGTGAASSSLSGTHGVGAVAGGIAGGAAVGVALGSVALAFIPALGALVVLTGVAMGAGAGSAIEVSQQTVSYPPVISVALSCKVPGEAMAPQPPARFGVGFRGLSAAEAKARGLGDRGAVLVTDVADGSAAQAGGLRRDDLLLMVDGKPVTDAAQLERLAAQLSPGNALTLRVWRAGEELDVVLLVPQSPP